MACCSSRPTVLGLLSQALSPYRPGALVPGILEQPHQAQHLVDLLVHGGLDHLVDHLHVVRGRLPVLRRLDGEGTLGARPHLLAEVVDDAAHHRLRDAVERRQLRARVEVLAALADHLDGAAFEQLVQAQGHEHVEVYPLQLQVSVAQLRHLPGGDPRLVGYRGRHRTAGVGGAAAAVVEVAVTHSLPYRLQAVDGHFQSAAAVRP